MRRFNLLIIGLITITFLSCKKTRSITVDNTKGITHTDILGTHTVHYDVHVIIGGVDCGVIQGGTVAGPFEIESGANLDVELFEIDPCLTSDSAYYLNSGISFCVGAFDDVIKSKAELFESTGVSVPVFNNSYDWKIGLGEI